MNSKRQTNHIFFQDTESTQALDNKGFSYFCITSVKTYNKYKVLAYDELTAERLYRHYPSFAGIDDMEGHFEFALNAQEAREYLLSLGMQDGGNARYQD